MIIWVKIIGFVAAVLTTGSFLPQAIKTWKTKSTDDLSPIMFILFCAGIILWLIYGIAKNDLPMILANSLTICLAGTILYYIMSPVKSHKVNHIALWVNDLEKMKIFYAVHFNAKPGKLYMNQTKGFSSYFMSLSSGIRLELMHQDSNVTISSSWGHFAISVGSKDNVDKYTEQLKANGVNVLQMPRLTGDGYYESLVEDIEGNHIEITI